MYSRRRRPWWRVPALPLPPAELARMARGDSRAVDAAVAAALAKRVADEPDDAEAEP